MKKFNTIKFIILTSLLFCQVSFADGDQYPDSDHGRCALMSGWYFSPEANSTSIYVQCEKSEGMEYQTFYSTIDGCRDKSVYLRAVADCSSSNCKILSGYWDVLKVKGVGFYVESSGFNRTFMKTLNPFCTTPELRN